jgi:hypothetical protein
VPDCCVAPAKETAVHHALRTAESRVGHPIFYPYEGTMFDSCEEAEDFTV